MGLLTALAGLAGLEVSSLVEKLKRNAVLYALMAVFGLIGTVFLLVAAFLGLAQAVGPIWSAVILAAAGFVGMLIVYLWGQASYSAKQVQAEKRRRSGEATALMTSAALAAAPLLPALMRSRTLRKAGLPVAALAAAGVFLWENSKHYRPPPRD